MAHSGGKKVVLAALAANGGIAVVKLGVAAFTGSVTMLAEAVHSVADTANQALLLVGMTLAVRRNPERYPLGRDHERYFWAFVVSLTLFLLGGVFAIFEGVHKLRGPDEGPPHSLWIPLVVLGVSLALELVSFTVALREFQRDRHGRPFFQALFGSKDPTVTVVLLEDSGAVLGLLIAFVSLGVSLATGSALPDVVGSILIGILLCVIGFLLAYDTHSLLIGESASPELRERALRAAEAAPEVEAVTQLLTLHLGPDAILLALKVRFRAGMVIADVERAIDELEERVRAEVPAMKRIFVEPDGDYLERLDPERSIAPRAPVTTSR